MKKGRIIFIIILGFVLIFTISNIYAEKTITLSNITIDIPDKFQNCEIYNSSNTVAYRNLSMNSKDLFSIYVYSNYSSAYIRSIGYWASKSNTEHVNIANHPAVLVKGNTSDRGTFTETIFESDGKIVIITIPHSQNVTNDTINMVASTPPAIYNEKDFYNLISETISDYEEDKYKQDLIDSSYENGYYNGYNDGEPKGVFSRLFWNAGL